MRFIFRYDDYCSNPAEDETDCRIFRCFGEHVVPLVVGITPEKAQSVNSPADSRIVPLTPSILSFQLLQSHLKHSWQLALHGLKHQRILPGRQTEFAGLPFPVQQEKIFEAVEKIRLCFPDYQPLVFIPPWNSFDDNTCHALQMNKFKIVCAGSTVIPSQRGDLLLVPSLFTLHQLIDYLRYYSLDDLKRTSQNKAIVVTLHAYEFMSPTDPRNVRYNDLETLLNALKDLNISLSVFDFRDSTKSFFAGTDHQFKAKRYYIAWSDQHRRGPWTSFPSMNFSAPQLHQKFLAYYSRAFYSARLMLKPCLDNLQRAWHRWIHGISRVKKLFLELSHPVGGYRVHFCPLCRRWGPFESVRNRLHARCLFCGSLERHRFIFAVLSSQLSKLASHERILIIAPDRGLVRLLKRHFLRVVTADLNRSDVAVRLNLEQLPFPTNFFNLILAIHVLDEVPNDTLALRECHRVLNQGGWLIAPVPQLDQALTRELSARRSDGKVRLAGVDYDSRFLKARFQPLLKLAASDFGQESDRCQFRIHSTFHEILPQDEEVTIFCKLPNSAN